MGNEETPFSKYAAQGGRARASVLTPDERKEIARTAARARWGASKGNKQSSGTPEQDAGTVEVAKEDSQEESSPPFSKFRGNLSIGGVECEAHVLNDLRRAFTRSELVRIASGRCEHDKLVKHLLRDSLIENRLESGPTIQFKVPGSSQIATGYEATLLVEICEKFLEARDKGLLKSSQLKLAKQAEIVIRACAKVGIDALIDEATGYQEVRAKHVLQLNLLVIIADEMQEWAAIFPEEFWCELARLESVHYSPRSRPLRWGRYLLIFVIYALDRDVAAEVLKRNDDAHRPMSFQDPKKYSDSQSPISFYEWLMAFGRDKVHDKIARAVPIMKSCENMEDFRAKFDKVFRNSLLQSDFDDIRW
jgi:hypothetical protein